MKSCVRHNPLVNERTQKSISEPIILGRVITDRLLMLGVAVNRLLVDVFVQERLCRSL